METNKNHISEEDIERKLKDYFQAEADKVRASADLWAKLEPRLQKVLGERQSTSAWQWLTSPWRPHPMQAVATVVVLLLAVMATWLFTATPWQGPPPAAPPGAAGPQASAGVAAPTATPQPGATPTLTPRPMPTPTAAPRPAGPAGPAGVTPTPPPVPRPAPIPTPTPSAGYQPGARGLAGAADSTSVGQSWAAERMVIRNGNVSLVVEDTARAIDRATQLAKDMGGYVVSSRTWQDGKKVAGTIAIRVPAELFSDAMRALKALALEVVTEDVSSQDVTEEYVDLASRLRNLEATEEQLLKVMQKATQVNDVLAVQRELTRVQAEIEQTKGRMQYLERSSATSLIQVTLREVGLDIVITASTKKARVGEEIKFSARVAGGLPPYSYQWDLGDGTASTEETPAHTYSRVGKFDVSLSIADDRGNTATDTKKELITISSMEVHFDASRTKAKLGEEIRFSARVAGGFPPYTYQWDLGGGTTSTEETPEHAYGQPGKFDVSLRVTDDKGNTATETRREFIAIAPMEVQFDTTLTEVKAGQEVRLSSQVAGGFPPYTYRWELGDGATSTMRNPAHTYSEAGSYTVSLTITDDKGNTASETRKQLITVTAAPGWSMGKEANGALRALSTVGKGLGTGLIWMVVLLPVWGLIIALSIAAILRRRRSS